MHGGPIRESLIWEIWPILKFNGKNLFDACVIFKNFVREV